MSWSLLRFFPRVDDSFLGAACQLDSVHRIEAECQPGGKTSHLRDVLEPSEVLSSGSLVIRRGQSAHAPGKANGEKRTGPALNPLKGSSARLSPTSFNNCKH